MTGVFQHHSGDLDAATKPCSCWIICCKCQHKHSLQTPILELIATTQPIECKIQNEEFSLSLEKQLRSLTFSFRDFLYESDSRYDYKPFS